MTLTLFSAGRERNAKCRNLSSWRSSIVGAAGFLRVNLGSFEVFYERRFGLGYGPYTVTSKDRTDAAALHAAAVSRDTLSTQALVADPELSFGVAF